MSSTLTPNEKVFKSLNCAKCEKPFLTDPSRAPRGIWFQKPFYLCCECFDREKAKKQEERWKPISDEDFKNDNPVKYLLELIADDSLQLNESRTGYIIAKEPFVSPECPVCFETYEIANPTKCPFIPFCHHAICFGCYRRMRTVFIVKCPICQGISREILDENGLKDFLQELPGMIDQYKAMKALRVTQSRAQCSTCPKKGQIQEMHYCVDCKAEICIHCAFDKHRLHNVKKLAKERAKAIAEETDQVTANQIDTYENLFNHLQAELIEKISELKLKFKESAGSLPEMEKYDEVIKKRDKCRQLGERFEEISEKFVPFFRTCNTELETLLKEFGK